MEEINKDSTLRPLIDEYYQLMMAGDSNAVEPLYGIFDYGEAKAREIRGGEMSYEDADKYLSSSLPMYDVAKETGGDMGKIADAYSNLRGIADAVKKNGYARIIFPSASKLYLPTGMDRPLGKVLPATFVALRYTVVFRTIL